MKLGKIHQGWLSVCTFAVLNLLWTPVLAQQACGLDGARFGQARFNDDRFAVCDVFAVPALGNTALFVLALLVMLLTIGVRWRRGTDNAAHD